MGFYYLNRVNAETDNYFSLMKAGYIIYHYITIKQWFLTFSKTGNTLDYKENMRKTKITMVIIQANKVQVLYN